jgi:hypothetical protein
MSRNNDPNPFEYVEDDGWVQVIKFQEFSTYNASVLRDYERRQESIPPQPSAHLDGEQPEDEDEEDDDERDELFKQGQFLVIVSADDEGDEPTPAQIRAYEWLNSHRTKVSRILIEHAYLHYLENIEGFRDFFNGEPQDRDRLLPEIKSHQDLKPLMQLAEIDIDETTLNGHAMITFQFDTTWDLEAYWGVTLNNGEIVDVDADTAPYPFILSRDLGWERLAAGHKGIRFAEFQYRGVWIGTFPIEPDGVCRRRILCTVCSERDFADPELIKQVRNAPTSHIISAVAHQLDADVWISRSLFGIVPFCFLLGVSWNSGLHWAGLVICLITVLFDYIRSGWKSGPWMRIALLEAAVIGFTLSPKWTPRKLDEAPAWTWTGLFETAVWLLFAFLAFVTLTGLRSMASNRLLRPAFWNVAVFAIAQIVGLLLVAVTDYSAFHLIWYVPLTTITMIFFSYRQVKKAIIDSVKDRFSQQHANAGPEVAWGQIREQMQNRGHSNSVFESRQRPSDEDD